MNLTVNKSTSVTCELPQKMVLSVQPLFGVYWIQTIKNNQTDKQNIQIDRTRITGIVLQKYCA